MPNYIAVTEGGFIKAYPKGRLALVGALEQASVYNSLSAVNKVCKRCRTEAGLTAMMMLQKTVIKHGITYEYTNGVSEIRLEMLTPDVTLIVEPEFEAGNIQSKYTVRVWQGIRTKVAETTQDAEGMQTSDIVTGVKADMGQDVTQSNVNHMLELQTTTEVHTVLQALQILNNAISSIRERPSIEQRLSHADKSISDLLHYIENYSMSAPECYDLAKRIKERHAELQDLHTEQTILGLVEGPVEQLLKYTRKQSSRTPVYYADLFLTGKTDCLAKEAY